MSSEPGLELMLIDSGVDDYEVLVADIVEQPLTDRRLQVVVLERDRAGITQITEALQRYQNIDAVHLVSH